MEGYVDRGYVFISPAQPNAISGTDVRVGLRKGSTEDKKDFFVKKAYGKFNQSIFDMVVDKLSKLPEITENNIYIPTEIIFYKFSTITSHYFSFFFIIYQY